MHKTTLNIILPVGISFYTFQTLSYTIDVYRSKLKPSNNFIAFASYVSFFPQLVAGPIERATNLLPQFYSKRVFDYNKARQGLNLIVLGFFKKVVIADNCAYFVNNIFSNYENLNSLDLSIGAVLFAFQIYGDFSGYSDIAIGVARLFGFNLMTNFKFPYFSRDIADFWRRWHISLSTWFRDYVYIPLGGSRGSKLKQIRNVFIIFLVSGFWHGANWTFIVWGTIHSLLFLILFLTNSNRKNVEIGTTFKDIFKIIFTFSMVCLDWVYFRADNVTHATHYIIKLFSLDFGSNLYILKTGKYVMNSLVIFMSISLLLILEYKTIKNNSEEVVLSKFILFILIALIFMLGSFKDQANFIYFQF